MRQKYFVNAFGVAGTITPAVPDATDPSGYVSYDQGFTFDYTRDLTTDPLAKYPTIANFNSILYSITGVAQALQQQGAPEFITSSDNGGTPFSYGLGSLVLYSASGNPPFHLYLSLVNANTALPTVTADWLDLTTFHSFPYGPLNQANTWTAAQTHTANVILANNISLLGTDTGNITRNLITYTSGDAVLLTGGQNGFYVNNNTNTQNNLIIDNIGNATFRGALAAAVGTGFSHYQIFNSNGTFTVPAGVTLVDVFVVGGGGGGSSSSATSGSTVSAAPGGNSGSWGQGIYAVTPAATIAVVVGNGGTHDNNGNSSSFGAFLSAPGGHTAGVVGANPPPLVQAPAFPSSVSTGGNINGAEAVGSPGISGTTANVIGGNGGNGPWGGGGGGTQSSNAGNGTAPGAGGGGAGSDASQSAFAGGSGAKGIVIVRW